MFNVPLLSLRQVEKSEPVDSETGEATGCLDLWCHDTRHFQLLFAELDYDCGADGDIGACADGTGEVGGGDPGTSTRTRETFDRCHDHLQVEKHNTIRIVQLKLKIVIKNTTVITT